MPLFDVMSAGRQVAALRDTWGHLKPAAGSYEGWIEVSYDGYREYGIFDWEAEGVCASPWLHGPLCTWASDLAQQLGEADETGKGLWRVPVRMTFTDRDADDYYDDGTVAIEQIGEPLKYTIPNQN